MTEIDLIPKEYQQWLWKIIFIKKLGWFLCGCLLLLLVTYGALEVETAQLKKEVKTLEARKTEWVEESNQYQGILEQQKNLQHLLDLLAELQQGLTSERLFVTLDRALEGGHIWFLKLEFKREIPVPAPSNPPPTQEMKLIVKHVVTLQGQATDHAVLARFIKQLFEQPAVAGVVINQTSTGQGSSNSLIDFDLTLVLKSLEKAGGHPV